MSSNRSEENPLPPRGIPWGIVILVTALVGAFAYLNQNLWDDGDSHPATGRPAPSLQLVRLIPSPQSGLRTDEDGIQSAANKPIELAGHVTLLHFWGTWCPPCRLEFPELWKMTRGFVDQPKFRWLNVSCGGASEEDLETLREETLAFYRKNGIGEPETFADPTGMSRLSLSQQLDVSMAYPTTLLIGADGRIAGVWIGYSPQGISQMHRLTQDLLRQAERHSAVSAE